MSGSSSRPRSEYDEAYQRVDEEIRERILSEFGSHSTRSGQSTSSYHTGYSQPQHDDVGASIPYQPYQPGQYLETINTGETLQLQDNPQPQDPYRSSYYSSDYSSHETHVDPYQYDTEAYASASGMHSRTQPYPRSRSPTPAVDDEDYYVVGNDSFHYTGPDPEKHAVHYNYYDPPPSHSFESIGSDLAKSQSPEPIAPLETRHFGNAPTGRVARRHKKKKRVHLVDGKYKVPIPIPPRMVLPRRGEPEMMEAEYTAVTCDPNDFEKEGYFLRQVVSGRRTELLIVITMYNEDEILFCRTLYGVMKNIQHLCTRKNSQTWGTDAWKKVVVTIIADGRKKVHPRVLDCLTLLGVYQPGPMKNNILEKPVTAHLFEYTTSFGLDPNLQFKYPDKGIVPTQIVFCMKEKNQKKINSHRWAFNAFAAQLQPNVCVLLDVGTRPGGNSIYKLWKVFDTHSNVGGACGEISVYKGKNWSLLLNPLVAAQNFEYKISCILDKPTESLFGYISVLPGAFSAYRYIALQNDSKGVGPLASYFKGEVLHGRETDIFTSNMYLAEDRILCFELIAKANENWVLKFVKGAVGETDVPDAIPEFISQRRRWLNGSFFAAVYAIAHVGQLMSSGHSFTRKIVLLMETVYNVINLTFAWFAIGNFYLFFVVLTSSLEAPYFRLGGIQYLNTIIQYALVLMIAACFLFCMGNKPRASLWKYKFTVIFLSVSMIYMLTASVFCAVAAANQGGTANSTMLYSVLISYGMYAISSVLAMDPWHMITSFVSYLLLSPTFINILSIYAFSNLDDISWGTKQDSVVEANDLGNVVQNNHVDVHVEVPHEMPDANDVYETALMHLRALKAPPPKPKGGGKPRPPPPSDAEKEQAMKDYYANVRTNVLLAWTVSNVLLIIAILKGTEPSGTFDEHAAIGRTKAYLIFILVFTTISNLIRFIGSTLYLLVLLIAG